MSFLVPLLNILKGVGHFDPPPVFPISKKPSGNRVNAGSILMVLKMHSDPYKVAYNAGFKAGKIRADKVTQMIFFNSFMSDNFV